MANIIATSAAELLKAMHKEDEKTLKELDRSINKHSLNAAGLGLIPIPIADVAALTVNVWHMYLKINKILGISFKDNKVKSIASAAIANIAGNLVGSGLLSLLKFVPGGSLAVGVVISASSFAACKSSAWIYLKFLTTIADRNNGKLELNNLDDGEIKTLMRANKKEQAKIAKEIREEYAKEHRNDK